jgi:hypothetical protein
MNKVKVGFFSFTEITDPAEHHSYNESITEQAEIFPDGAVFTTSMGG